MSAYVEALRAFCAQLPGSTEDLKWGSDLCFLVGGKMYTVVGLSSDRGSTSLKVPDVAFENLIQQPGIRPAPYLARNKWVSFYGTEDLEMAAIQALVRGSHQLVLAKLPKKVQKEILR